MKPWIEKYRPIDLSNIKLDETYKIVFDTMIETLFIPHMLFYGPPGTGKTTTINCLLSNIKEKYNMKHNIIHLNASDDRGVDIIRNTIYNFVQSDGLFTNSEIKFVVLDEVDSMTKQAQQSLLLLLNKKNIKFFLICNYISKLIPALRYKCLTIHFYNIPDYKEYLHMIIQKENVSISNSILNDIIYNYYPDIRSMVNALQSYKYIRYHFIKEKQIHSLCHSYSITKLKHMLKTFSCKEVCLKLFMHMLMEFKMDSKLISHMKKFIFNRDLDYLDKIVFPYFFYIQN